MYKQGEIYFINLESSKGNEERKTRPCIIVSNNQYNRVFNTVIVVPISSAKKYQTEEKFRKSPLFVFLNKDKVYGTALLQHIRTIDPNKRISGSLKGKLTDDEMQNIKSVLQQFF